MTHRTVQPEGWPRPKGYSNGMAGRGEILAVAGQVAWDEREQIVSEDFVEQFKKCIDNVATIVEAAGGKPEHVVNLTLFVTDKDEYEASLAGVGKAYRERMGKHFPAMALVQVAALLEKGAKLEIQALAVLP